jgi:hypothetical protein
MGGNRPVYVMLPLESEDGWKFYETCARDSRLKGAEVVSEVASLTGGEILVQGTSMTKEVIADPIVVEQPSQNECQHVTHRVSLGSEIAKANSESHALARDEFYADTLDKEPSNEQNVDENDEPSNTDNEEESNEALVGIGGEGNDSTVPQSLLHVCDVPTCSRINRTLYYIEEEFKALK